MSLFKKQTTRTPARRAEASSRLSTRASAQNLDERYAFRRNRTLTGSLSSSVSSVSEHRAELKSTRVHAHTLRRHRRKLVLIFAGVAVVAIGLSLLIYQTSAVVRVASVSERGGDDPIYAAKIQDYLSLHPLERFRFATDTASLTSYLQDNGCPEVQRVTSDMAFDGIGATRFILEFRRPVVSWSTGATHVYVDESGVAFDKNYFDEPSVKVVDQTGIGTQNNQVLASSRFLGFIGKVIGRMKQYDMIVTSVALPAGTTRQIAITIQNIPYPIKLSVDRPVGEQAEDASRAVRYLDSKGRSPEYLDVRVSGKAFYK